MKSQVLEQPNFEHEEQIQNARISQIKARTKNGFKALFIFLTLALSIPLYRYLIIKDIVAEGRIYQNIQHFSYNDQSQNQFNPSIDQGTLAVTQQQLENMVWTILHMSTATFPQNFQLTLSSKFHTFLILFAQLYPCKQCGNIFLKHLDQMKPFNGTTKSEIMAYLCSLHNKINKENGKNPQDCLKVQKEWSLKVNQP